MIPLDSRVIVLEKYKSLFKDDESFKTFAQRIREVNGESLIVLDDAVIGSVLPGEEASRRAKRRIIKTLKQNNAPDNG